MTTQTLQISDLLAAGSVISHLSASSKLELIQNLAQFAAKEIGKDAHAIVDVLWEREKLGTTGVGYGIAIPHGRIEGLEQVHGFFVRLEEPINYDSIDEKPVDIVFLLLAPESAGADHLHALSMVSRLLRDKQLCEQLRRAKGEKEIYRLFSQAAIAEAA